MVLTIGIDLAPVRSAVAVVQMNDNTWSGKFFAWKTGRLIQDRIEVADTLRELVRRYQPDIVGLEDYTNQSFSHTAFEFGEIGGLVRRELYLLGQPTFLIMPGRRWRLVPTGRTDYHKALRDYWSFPELHGDKKAIEDQTDAGAYAFIAGMGWKMLKKKTFIFKHDMLDIFTNKKGTGLLDKENGYYLDKVRDVHGT